jgi:lipopolysaccharide/colanic/teichoic acid biosynthesis glycosyltransferase
MERKFEILYIGNSPEAINLLRDHPDIQLVTYGNLIMAINYINSDTPPDAILCELNFPGSNGFDVFNMVRREIANMKIPFILLSHEYKEEQIKQAFAEKVDDYHVLPLKSADDILDRFRFIKKFKESIPVEIAAPDASQVFVMPLSKRIFDILVAGFALLCLSPFLLIIVIAIRLESKGKVYYISKRVGRKPFDFYKLRSMRVGADAELKKLAKEKNQYASAQKKEEIDFDKPCPRCAEMPEGQHCSSIMHVGVHEICDYWYMLQKKEIAGSKASFVKISNDPRVTKVGKFIRNTSIDELPQLINVLKGDMSIVGNRPLPVYEAELLTGDFISKRFLAPAGITGLWQVELRGKGGVMSEDERKRLDNEYADHFIGDNYSFWYDLKLILRTVPALFQKDSV